MGRHRSARKYRRRRVEEKNENRKEGVRDTVTWHRMSPLPGHRSACIFSNSVSVFTSRFSRGVATAWRGHSVACRLPRHRPPLSLRIPQRRGMGEVAEGTNLTPNGNLTRGRYSLADRTSRPHPPGYQCHLSNFQFY